MPASPGSQQRAPQHYSGGGAAPPVHDVREILGDKVPPLQVGPKASSTAQPAAAAGAGAAAAAAAGAATAAAASK